MFGLKNNSRLTFGTNCATLSLLLFQSLVFNLSTNVWTNRCVVCLQRCHDKDSITNQEDIEMGNITENTVHVPEGKGGIMLKVP